MKKMNRAVSRRFDKFEIKEQVQELSSFEREMSQLMFESTFENVIAYHALLIGEPKRGSLYYTYADTTVFEKLHFNASQLSSDSPCIVIETQKDYRGLCWARVVCIHGIRWVWAGDIQWAV